MPNRLAKETSPYLQQHADNPVDWYPWGEEALAEAKRTNKPILLSVGYSACHWCHVMAHESFEDPEIAAVMNDLFVNIKVDREERPDLDQIYQTAHADAHAAHRRLAAHDVPHARRQRRSSAAPISQDARATACRAFAELLERVARASTTSSPTRSREQSAAACARRFDAHAAASGAPASRSSPASRSTPRPQISRRRFDARARRLRRRAQVPASATLELLPAPLRAATATQAALDAGHAHAAQDGRGRHLRPARRRLRRYSVDERLGDPALREDALRQRAAAAPATPMPGRVTREPLFARVLRGDRGAG